MAWEDEDISAAERELIPQWDAVDEYTMSHLQPSDTAKVLNDTLKKSEEHGLPGIYTGPTIARLLALQCQFGGVTHALEIGTLGGYGSLSLALHNPNIKVVSVEYDPKHVVCAKENIKHAGLESRIEVIQGPGLEVLPRIKAEIDAGKREKFGLTYIDADKENNWAYVDMAIEMSKPGAAIVVDNVVFNGTLIQKDKFHVEGVSGARKVIEMVGKDERISGVVLQTASTEWDGILFAVVK